MLVLLRLLIFFLILCYYHYGLIYSHLDFGRWPSLAYGVLLSSFIVTFYFYGKWCIFIHKNTLKKYSRKYLFLENVLFPIFSFLIFGLPLAGGEIFDALFLFCSVLSFIILLDLSFSISNFIWGIRFYEFSSYPEDGVVHQKALNKNGLLVFCFYVLIPVFGFLVRDFYS